MQKGGRYEFPEKRPQACDQKIPLPAEQLHWGLAILKKVWDCELSCGKPY